MGYKVCGKGDVDKLLCIREQERCPINHIEITSNTNPPKEGYKTVPLDPQQGVSFINPLFLIKNPNHLYLIINIDKFIVLY
jgi:hypothetical protein